MKKQRMATWAALTALALFLPPALSAGAPAHRAVAARGATLAVTNNNPQPVFVVLIDERSDGWAQWPLGTIAKGASRTFEINRDVLGLPNIRIVATAFSNWKEYQSNPLTFRRGRQLDLTLNNPEPFSLLAAT
jgi:hypothetical protein